jgi:hypothetical protein
MGKSQFKVAGTPLPITMDQFQALTNEILVEINKLCAPHFLDSDYVAQIVMSAIHAMDHKIGYIKKADLLAGCINRISCHVTYHAVQAIQERIKAKAAEEGKALEAVPTEDTGSVEQETAAVL